MVSFRAHDSLISLDDEIAQELLRRVSDAELTATAEMLNRAAASFSGAIPVEEADQVYAIVHAWVTYELGDLAAPTGLVVLLGALAPID